MTVLPVGREGVEYLYLFIIDPLDKLLVLIHPVRPSLESDVSNRGLCFASEDFHGFWCLYCVDINVLLSQVLRLCLPSAAESLVSICRA